MCLEGEERGEKRNYIWRNNSWEKFQIWWNYEPIDPRSMNHINIKKTTPMQIIINCWKNNDKDNILKTSHKTRHITHYTLHAEYEQDKNDSRILSDSLQARGQWCDILKMMKFKKKKKTFKQTKAERIYYKKTCIMRTIKVSSSHKRNMILDGIWIYTKEWRVKKR